MRFNGGCPGLLDGMVMESTDSLCKSSIFATPDNFSNSAIEPTQTDSSPSSLIQTGIGVPQYRLRDKFQSLASLSQLAKRPSRIDSGTQYVWSFLSIRFCLICCTRINHEGT